MAMLKIKKGDMVRVIAGKDKNKEGRVLSVDAKKNRIVVEGVNMITKRRLPTSRAGSSTGKHRSTSPT